jgi:hypothetical protein
MNVFILNPTPLTTAMLSSSSITEPDTGETVWNAATSYTVGQRVILTATHRVYECLIAGVNATSPELTLALTAPRWFDYGPTNRWAAFDGMVNTPSTAVASLSYVLRPGLFNALAFYGLDGATISVSIKDAPGGTVFYTYSGALQDAPLDYYDYYFGRINTLSKLLLEGILPQADPEITITITAAAGVTVKAGMIAIGDMRQLLDDGNTGGAQYGATAEPISYSYIKTDDFGRTSIKRRNSATNMQCSVHMPQADADTALELVQDVLDVPCAVIGANVPGYAGLNVFGLVSGRLSYDGPSHAIFNLTVKGFI